MRDGQRPGVALRVHRRAAAAVHGRFLCDDGGVDPLDVVVADVREVVVGLLVMTAPGEADVVGAARRCRRRTAHVVVHVPALVAQHEADAVVVEPGVVLVLDGELDRRRPSPPWARSTGACGTVRVFGLPRRHRSTVGTPPRYRRRDCSPGVRTTGLVPPIPSSSCAQVRRSAALTSGRWLPRLTTPVPWLQPTSWPAAVRMHQDTWAPSSSVVYRWERWNVVSA